MYFCQSLGRNQPYTEIYSLGVLFPGGQLCDVVWFLREKHEKSHTFCTWSWILDACLLCDCPGNSSCQCCIHILYISIDCHLFSPGHLFSPKMHLLSILLIGRDLDNSFYGSLSGKWNVQNQPDSQKTATKIGQAARLTLDSGLSKIFLPLDSVHLNIWKMCSLQMELFHTRYCFSRFKQHSRKQTKKNNKTKKQTIQLR